MVGWGRKLRNSHLISAVHECAWTVISSVYVVKLFIFTLWRGGRGQEEI